MINIVKMNQNSDGTLYYTWKSSNRTTLIRNSDTVGAAMTIIIYIVRYTPWNIYLRILHYFVSN